MMKIKRILIFIAFLFLPAVIFAGTNDAFYDYNNGQYLKALSGIKDHAKQNDKVALFYLGMMYINGYGEALNLNRGIKLMSESAERGYLPAQMFLGRYYLQEAKDPEKALLWFKKATAQDDVDAQMFTAAAFLHGYGVKKDPEKAKRYYIDAAKNGNSIAQYHLAIRFINSKYRKNRELGLLWLKKSARNNNPNARYELASMYCEGKHVSQDIQKGIRWLSGAAKEGNPKVAILLAKCYQSLGGPSNHAKALFWYQTAAKTGDLNAQLQLGEMYLSPNFGTPDGKKGYLWILQAALGGNADAQQRLASMYENGNAVQKDIHLAEQWRLKAQKTASDHKAKTKAANPQGLAMQWLTDGERTDTDVPRYRLAGTIWAWNAAGTRRPGTYNLSPKLVFVRRAQIFKSDFTLAQPNEIELTDIIRIIGARAYRDQKRDMVFPRYPFPENVDHEQYFKRLSYQALHGNPRIQFELGQMHGLGLSIVKDINKSIHWYLQAAEQNYLKAEYSLGLLYLEGDGVKRDYKKAVLWLDKAAFRGSTYAQYALGLIYEHGLGSPGDGGYIPKNIRKAEVMYGLASSNGYAQAQYNLAELYSSDFPNDAQTVKARRQYTKLIMSLYQDAAKGGVKQAMLPLAYYYAGLKNNAEKQQWAFDIVKANAKDGNSFASFFLGLMYDRGLGVDKNTSRAIRWYQKVDSNDFPLAQFILGTCYYLGEGVHQDKTKGVDLLTQAAEHGLPYAAYNLAIVHYQNHEKDAFLSWLNQAVSKKYDKAGLLLANYYLSQSSNRSRLKTAVENYSRLAEMGYANAQLRLGYLFEQGIYVSRNFQRAADLYTKAAKQGNAIAAYLLGNMSQVGKLGGTKHEEAKTWYRKAVGLGFAPATLALGFIYETVDHNPTKAIEWYQQAADKNIPQGQFNLALMYQYGKGVEVDNGKAYGLYKKAAAQGFAPAKYALGTLYLYRSGRGSDGRWAHALYQQAADQGDLYAMYQLALLDEAGVGTPINPQQAFVYYKKAAQKGHTNALMALARLYDLGLGVAQDKDEAFRFYQRAAARGNALAQYQLARMYQIGTDVPENLAMAKVLYRRSAGNGNSLAQEKLEQLTASASEATANEKPQEGNTVQQSVKKQTVPADIKSLKINVPRRPALMYMVALNELNEGNVQRAATLFTYIVQQFPGFLPVKRSLEYLKGSGTEGSPRNMAS